MHKYKDMLKIMYGEKRWYQCRIALHRKEGGGKGPCQGSEEIQCGVEVGEMEMLISF